MDEMEDLKGRLNALESKIDDVRTRLKLKEIFYKDHQVTAEELEQRYRLLADQLGNQVDNLESHGAHVDNFEKTVLGWVNSFNLEH